MKTQSTALYILRLSVTLLLITGVMAALLGGVNAITEPRIEAINEAKTVQAIAAVLPDPQDAVALERFPNSSGVVAAVYQSGSGYAIEVKPTGFDGEIDMMVGVDLDGKVLGISIISHTETAGLGAVAASDTSKGHSFREQFIGMSGTLAVTKDGGTVDALTSATITSRGVTAGVNAALACAAELG